MEANKCIWNDFFQAKNDYMYLFYKDIRDPLNHYFEDIYNECVSAEQQNNPEDDNRHVLKAFQDRLTKLSVQVDDIVIESIKKDPDCDCYYKDELIKCVFLMQFRWMVVKPSFNHEMDVVLPSFNRIMKRVVQNMALEFRRYAYLFIDSQVDKSITLITMQDNINRRRELIWTVIYESILTEMPMKELYKLLREDMIVAPNRSSSKKQKKRKSDIDGESYDSPAVVETTIKSAAITDINNNASSNKKVDNNSNLDKNKDKDEMATTGGQLDLSNITNEESNPTYEQNNVVSSISIPNTNNISFSNSADNISEKKNEIPVNIVGGSDDLEEIDLLSANSLPTVNVSFENPPMSMQHPSTDQLQFNEINL
tara:strand:+ start:2414 stop:3517 length:1104 start_codon:yes stop_codon:yes gene_type:complete